MDPEEREALRERLSQLLVHDPDPVAALVDMIAQLCDDAYEEGYSDGVGEGPVLRRRIDDVLGSL